jgi:hypothetical protein
MTSLARTCAAITLAVLIAGCTASDPRLDDSDVGGRSPVANSPAIPSAAGPSATSPGVPSPGVPTPIVSHNPASSPPAAAVSVEDIPPTEGVLNAIWVGDGKVVVGGFKGPVFTGTILVFDGSSWSAADVPVAPGQITGIAKIGDRLIAVGNGLPDSRTGYIWESADGRTWRAVQTIEDAALYDVVSGDGVIVTAGARLDAEMHATAAAWSSTDGRTWKPAKVADGDGTAMGTVTPTSEGFAATGDRPLGKARPFWVASAATSWQAQANDLSDQLLPMDMVHRTEGLALVGASGKSGDQHPFVALSADGRRWKQTNLSSAEGYASAVAMADERLVVAGVDADRLTLWSLRGGSWQAETIEQSGSSISMLTWDADRGLVAAGARDGHHAVWALERN